MLYMTHHRRGVSEGCRHSCCSCPAASGPPPAAGRFPVLLLVAGRRLHTGGRYGLYRLRVALGLGAIAAADREWRGVGPEAAATAASGDECGARPSDGQRGLGAFGRRRHGEPLRALRGSGMAAPHGAWIRKGRMGISGMGGQCFVFCMGVVTGREWCEARAEVADSHSFCVF